MSRFMNAVGAQLKSSNSGSTPYEKGVSIHDRHPWRQPQFPWCAMRLTQRSLIIRISSGCCQAWMRLCGGGFFKDSIHSGKTGAKTGTGQNHLLGQQVLENAHHNKERVIVFAFEESLRPNSMRMPTSLGINFEQMEEGWPASDSSVAYQNPPDSKTISDHQGLKAAISSHSE